MDFTKELSAKFPEAPVSLWKHFYQLTQIPRPSTHEQKVSAFILDFAKSKGCFGELDSVGNVLVRVGGKGKYKNSNLPAVIIQNHTDMVTDARPGKIIDFYKDPITCFLDHEWLKAKDTTLGADNGIGCATALALIDLDEGQDVPPLELLFTIDEERGLHGAKGLKSGWLKGEVLLNLDTEEWGAAYVGCAGGMDLEFESKLSLTDIPKGYVNYQLSIANLVGGHSGLDIHLQRANSIKLLTELILELPSDVYLLEFKAGKAHNIIPRDAYFTLAIDPTKHKTVIDALLNKWTTSWRSHLNKDDQALEVKGQVLNTPVPSKGIKEVEWRRIFSGISLFPHGPHSFIKDGGEKLKDLVQASSNLAKLIIMNEQLYIQTSIRSFRNFERDLLIQKMRAFAQVLNFSLKEGVGYPGWAPNFEHPINRYARKVYQDLFKEDLEFKAIHAGLECGLLLEKYPHLKAISIGPTIKGAHSPDERVHIPSVTEFWKFLTTMLKNIDQLA
jgi:dipeptidase D